MPSLRVIAFVAYLVSWLALIAGAIGSWFGASAPSTDGDWRSVAGMLLQVAGAAVVVMLMAPGLLQPSIAELWLVLVLAPFAALLFLAAVYAGRRGGLIDTGAFAWVRHPMYLAFLAMLVATAAVVAAGPRALAGVALYVAGTELRIAEEEAGLLDRFGEAYDSYRRRVRWRYLPGIR